MGSRRILLMAKPRGFAAMTPERLKEVAIKGGATIKRRGFDNPETARLAAKKRWGVDKGKASDQDAKNE